MRVIRKQNPHLIDKENEIWGLEQDEIGVAFLLSVLLMVLLIVVLGALSVPSAPVIGIFSLFPILLTSLYLIKKRKDKSLARGNLQRELYEFFQRKILRKRKVYT